MRHKDHRIYVAGHTGLIGSAFVREFAALGFENVLVRTHAELDLCDGTAVDRFFDDAKPEYVVLAAGKVGGILENRTRPASFIDSNLSIQLNVLRAAHRLGVKRLVLFGSSCMYPRDCPQPMAETALLTGHPEPTSLAYAISKLAGVQLCLAYNQQYGERRFIPLIPNSAFGPNDNFNPETGHVLSALLSRFHLAKANGIGTVTLWGTGTPRREFIHSRDIARAGIFALTMEDMSLELPANVGSGADISIRELAVTLADVVGYKGEIVWDAGKPDGAPRKLLDSTRLRSAGWAPEVAFDVGLRDTYRWYVENVSRSGS